MTSMIKTLALEILQIEAEMAAAIAPFELRKQAVYRRAGAQKKLVKMEAQVLRLEASGKPRARAAQQQAITAYMAALAPQGNSLPSGTEVATRARCAHPENSGGADV